MIFRLTENAQEKLKTGKLSTVSESVLFDEWYADFFSSNRYKYFVITNAATLVSVIIPGAGIRSDSDFLEAAFEALELQFNDMACPFIFHRNIEQKAHDIILSNTNNQKVLQSMNDIVVQAGSLLEAEHMDPFAVSRVINDMPLEYIGMSSPSDYVKKYRLYV